MRERERERESESERVNKQRRTIQMSANHIREHRGRDGLVVALITAIMKMQGADEGWHCCWSVCV